MIQHIKAKPSAVRLNNCNIDNDLKACLLTFQKLIDDKVKEGKKGVVLNKGTEQEYKMSYKKLQSLLWELDTYFGLKGAFTYGICGNCRHFQNSCSIDGTFGRCQGVSDRVMFESCKDFESE